MNEWIDEPAALGAWIARQPQQILIAMDTEFMRTDTFRPKLALIQVNLGGTIALLDAPKLGAHAALAARLRDPASLCVMHSASEDLEAMAPLLPDGPAALFDTQIAAAMAGLGTGLSYQKLVALLIGVDLPKAETRSDWLQRPLTPAQLDYAAQDVAWLPELQARLAVKLDTLGRSAWLAEDCARLVDRICHAQPDPEPQRAFRGAADWPREQQALLRRVLLWRDASARTLDKPRSWILDDAHALNLSAQPPRDGNELFERSKGLRALRSAQRQELLAVLQAPLSAEELQFAPIPAPLTGPEKRILATMRDDVAAIAARLELPDGLLCPRRHLETLLGERAWPAALEGWRKPLLHDVLMGRMAARQLEIPFALSVGALPESRARDRSRRCRSHDASTSPRCAAHRCSREPAIHFANGNFFLPLDRPPPHRFHLPHALRHRHHDNYDDDHDRGAVRRAQLDFPANHGPAPQDGCGRPGNPSRIGTGPLLEVP